MDLKPHDLTLRAQTQHLTLLSPRKNGVSGAIRIAAGATANGLVLWLGKSWAAVKRAALKSGFRVSSSSPQSHPFSIFFILGCPH